MKTSRSKSVKDALQRVRQALRALADIPRTAFSPELGEIHRNLERSKDFLLQELQRLEKGKHQ